MKTKLIGLIAVVMLAVTAFAQEYLNRQPSPEETRRVAGIPFHLASGPLANFLQYGPSNYQPFALHSDATNHVVFFSLAPTNVYAILPDCTQAVGRVFTLVAAGRTTVIVTNANQQTFSDPTNCVDGTPGGIWTMRTNTAIRIHSTGTNWFVIPDKD
jgi:hypothetical protein